MGPRGAQVGGPKLGPSGPKPEIWDPKNQKKLRILKIQIRSAQNVGKVWISREKNHPGPIGDPLGTFFAWAGKIQKMSKKMTIFLGGPMELRRH